MHLIHPCGFQFMPGSVLQSRHKLECLDWALKTFSALPDSELSWSQNKWFCHLLCDIIKDLSILDALQPRHRKSVLLALITRLVWFFFQDKTKTCALGKCSWWQRVMIGWGAVSVILDNEMIRKSNLWHCDLTQWPLCKTIYSVQFTSHACLSPVWGN